MTKNNQKKLEELISEILSFLDKEPARPGLKNTAKNVAKSFTQLTQGNDADIAELISKSLIKSNVKDLVILKNIEFYSLCEHHLLPFFGHAHIAFLPNKHLIGIGTLAHVVDTLAAKLQLQENLTEEIAESLWKTLKPHGLIVILEARHFCVMMRGSKKQNSIAKTMSSKGIYQTDALLRQEVIKML